MSGSRESASAAPAPDDDVTFETALGRLEAIVDRLEHGELELEVALSAFEEGVGLARRCASQLDAAERRIEILVREGERWLARPFEAADVPGESD